MQATTPQPAQTRLRLHRLAGEGGATTAFAEDVRRGLTSHPKRLFPKYFYDELGSLLFEAICKLPEYYLTRAEDEILSRHADEIAKLACEGLDEFLFHDEASRDAPKSEPVTLVEFGSGSSAKTRRVVEALLRRQQSLLYVPIDISHTALEAGAHALLDEYPRLRVEAYAGDYDAALARLGEGREERGRTLALFLGSNVGNFEAAEAGAFLRRVRGVLSAGDALLVGADLKKDAAILEAAYDDPLGVTAAFNLNLLARINRELGADFDPRNFRHVARYDESAGRVEMYVESKRAQTVRVRALGLEVGFAAGERVHTENSHKYDAAQLSDLARGAGFVAARAWRDEANLFSSNLLVAAAESEPTRS
ncbi:MAG: L-histidine N(alpha)-methyltransferase [Acidobacteria bacterium]|nr:L-histidine N(alpha)-methyltransferase [Acidobacteriota bacterium]MCA1643197.1 L-histidine N(alpha)-methyltransferase [Acidobacteriota bacterium]